MLIGRGRSDVGFGLLLARALKDLSDEQDVTGSVQRIRRRTCKLLK